MKRYCVRYKINWMPGVYWQEIFEVDAGTSKETMESSFNAVGAQLRLPLHDYKVEDV